MSNIRLENQKKLQDTYKNTRLRELRTAAGLSQEALGKKIGASGQAISHLESGKRKLTSDMAKRLADYFNVSTDYLLYVNNVMDTDLTAGDVTAAKIFMLAGKIAGRPALEDLFSAAQLADDDGLYLATTLLQAYVQRKAPQETTDTAQ